MKYIGVDIGGTKCAVVLGNENGEAVRKISFPTANCKDTIENIKNAVKEMGESDAIGISCGGPLNSKTGVVMSPPNLPDWDNIPICDILNKEFGVPVFLQNDADACALAEWKYGAGKGTENMMFLTFGTGLGAGLILNGNLYSGASGMAGEIGHIRLAPDGPVGYGKKGSFEGFCSGGGIGRMGQAVAKEMFEKGEKPSFCEDVSKISEITAKKIAECANAGYEDAIRIYGHCGEMLGKGLSILIDVLNPERIVIGSIFARCENLLRDSMQRVIDEETLSQSSEACTVVPAMLGESIGDVAAITVAVEGLRKCKN